MLHVGSVTPDATTALGFISRIDAIDNRPGVTREPTEVAIIDVATGRRRMIRTLPSTTHEAGHAAADARWFVWAERSSAALLTDWTLLAYDRNSDSVREVTRAPRSPDGRPMGSWVSPRVDEGVLVWSESIPPTVAEPEPALPSRVMLVRLPDGAPEEVARSHGGGPWISWPYLAWIERRGERNTIVRRHLETGRSETVRGADDVTGVAIEGTATAWVDRPTGRLWLSETPGAEPQLLAEPDQRDSPFQDLEMSERFVGWFSNTFPGVYDRRQRRVVIVDDIGVSAGWHVAPRGNALRWAMRPAADTPFLREPVRDFAILDARRLPARP